MAYTFRVFGLNHENINPLPAADRHFRARGIGVDAERAFQRQAQGEFAADAEFVYLFESTTHDQQIVTRFVCQPGLASLFRRIRIVCF
jgi:hypothetical protein